LYKCVGNAVVGCGWAFHNASLTTRRSRFLSFGCGFAALCLCGFSEPRFGCDSAGFAGLCLCGLLRPVLVAAGALTPAVALFDRGFS